MEAGYHQYFLDYAAKECMKKILLISHEVFTRNLQIILEQYLRKRQYIIQINLMEEKKSLLLIVLILYIYTQFINILLHGRWIN